MSWRRIMPILRTLGADIRESWASQRPRDKKVGIVLAIFAVLVALGSLVGGPPPTPPPSTSTATDSAPPATNYRSQETVASYATKMNLLAATLKSAMAKMEAACGVYRTSEECADGIKSAMKSLYRDGDTSQIKAPDCLQAAHLKFQPATEAYRNGFTALMKALPTGDESFLTAAKVAFIVGTNRLDEATRIMNAAALSEACSQEKAPEISQEKAPEITCLKPDGTPEPCEGRQR
jgi:hypothetical protein